MIYEGKFKYIQENKVKSINVIDDDFQIKILTFHKKFFY